MMKRCGHGARPAPPVLLYVRALKPGTHADITVLSVELVPRSESMWKAVAARALDVTIVFGILLPVEAAAPAHAAARPGAAPYQAETSAQTRTATRAPKGTSPLVVDTSDAIPLRDCQHRRNMFAVSLAGSAIRGPQPYEVHFDTGSSQLCLPYGCLDKSKLKVLAENVRDCWGHKADRVQGQISMASRDGKTTYMIDDYVFYAMKADDGTDRPDDRTAEWSASIMGAYPCPEAFTYLLARKYCKSGLMYGIVCENQSGEMVSNWAAMKAYLKIGSDPAVAARVNWHNYTPWFPGQTELQVVNLPGWVVRLSFPRVNGRRVPDIVVPNQIATIDTGAPDLTMRLGKDDLHRNEPYKHFFNDKVPHWYSKDKCIAAGPGITVEVSFTGSSGRRSSYRWTTSEPEGRYVPSTLFVGDWTAGIPWAEGPETPTNRLNLGNSIYFFNQVHLWDIANRRVGFYFR